MSNKSFLILCVIALSLITNVSLGDDKKTKDKPYIVIVGPQELNKVRVNIENYEPTDKDVKKSEIDFGDGTAKAINSDDVYHTYSQNRSYTITIKTWDSKNKLTTYSENIQINSQSIVSDIPNSTILGPMAVRDEKKYSLNLSTAQSSKLYKLTIFKTSDLDQPKHKKDWNKHKKCKADYNVEINDLDIFKENEISCSTTLIEKFVKLNAKNVIRFEADEPYWKNSFKIKINAVEFNQIPTDVSAPTLSSNIQTNSLTRNDFLHISVSDVSNTITYVWDENNVLLQTELNKEFDIPLFEGINNYKIQSVDAYQNQSQFLNLVNITKDTTSPILAINSNSEYIYSSYPQNFKIQINSNENLSSVYVNGASAQLVAPSTYEYYLTISNPQIVNLAIVGVDYAGNSSTISQNITFGIDNISPTVTTNLLSNLTTKNQRFQVSVVDNSAFSTQVYINNSKVIETTNSAFDIDLALGNNNIQIVSTDAYNNQTLLNFSNIVFDNVAPVISATAPQNTLFNQLPQNLNYIVNFNEPLTELSYSLNGGSLVAIHANQSPLNASISITHSGQQSIVFTGVDIAGNSSIYTLDFHVYLDNSAPTITIGSYDSLTNQNSINLPITITDANSTQTNIKVNGELILENYSLKSFTFAAPLNNEGTNTIEVSTTDLAGNQSQIQSITINRDTVPPKLSQLFPEDTAIFNSLSVLVTGHTSELLSGLTINNESAALDSNSNFSKNISFNEYGQKVISIKATDLAGNEAIYSWNINLQDDAAPKIISNLKNGFTNINQINIQVEGPAQTNLQVLINGGEQFNSISNSYVTEFQFGETLHNIEVIATSPSGKQTREVYDLTLDTQPPFINIYNAPPTTTSDSVDITYTFWDSTPATFRVVADQQLIYESSEMFGFFTIPTLADGSHMVSIAAIDSAGNMSEPLTFEIFKDATAPVITILEPENNSYVDANSIKVKAKVDDQVINIRANGLDMVWNETEHVWEQILSSGNTDDFQIKVTATNRLNQEGEQIVIVKPLVQPLVKSLLGLYEDSINNKMIVKGAEGATRPYMDVKISYGLFNSQTIKADKNGSFMVLVPYRDEYTISVNDPYTSGNTTHILKRFNQEIILSGIVKDDFENPLRDVQVTLTSKNISAWTDENGVFKFLTSDYPDLKIQGDQVIVFNGLNANNQSSSRPRKFSSTTMNVSLSNIQNNVIQKTIYMYPQYLDTAQTLSASGGGVLTSDEAPGVILNVASDIQAQFPSGQISEQIQIFTVDSSKISIAPPAAAMPEQVVVLEPSGTTFSGSVELTLPNSSNFPPKTSMFIMLFNSKTGKWEAGGSAKVSEDGLSVVTKPNEGIRHFSVAYAMPAPADILSTAQPDKPGADSFSGAVSTKIETASFKVIGQKVTPSLVYKSSWAKPSATITNIFNIPDKEISMASFTESGNISESYAVSVISCRNNTIFGQPFDWMFKELQRNLDSAGYNRKKEAIQSELAQNNLLPENCTASEDKKIFYNNFDYTYNYSNLTAKIQPKKVDMTVATADIVMPTKSFNKIPNVAQLSQFLELKNSQGQYLSSGIYPYIANYKIYYDKLITGTLQSSYYDYVTNTSTTKTEPLNQKIENEWFGSDLIDNLFVQNQRNSAAGQGWKIAGIQKIVNPNSQRILLEEADGSISTYSVDNTIETVADLNSLNGDLSKGISLNTWPEFVYTDKDSNQVKKASLGNNNHYSVSSIGTIPEVNGSISGYTYYNWTAPGEQYTWEECVERLYFPGGNICVRTETRVSYYQLPKSTCKVNSYPVKQKSLPSKYLATNNGVYVLDQSRYNLGYLSNGNYTDLLATKSSFPKISGFVSQSTTDIFSYQVIFDEQKTNEWITSYSGIERLKDSNNSYLKNIVRNDNFEYYNACGTPSNNVPDSSGEFYNTYFNSPTDIIQSYDSNYLLIADSGSSSFSSYNILTGEKTDISVSNGKPRGLAVDQNQNIYVSTDIGHIYKFDVNGNQTLVAGDALNGQLLNEGDPLKLKFNSPYGLAFDNLENILYVADTGHNRIVKIDFTKNLASVFAGTGQPGDNGEGKSALEAQISNPTHIFIDQNRNLIISDTGNNKIKKVPLGALSSSKLTYKSNSNDHSLLVKNTDGTWERQYRNKNKDIFNSHGFHIKSISSNLLESTYEYDTNNNLLKVKFPNNQEINYTYSGGKLASITDVSGKVTSFDHNSDGQLTKVIFPDQTQKQYTYDNNGLLTEERNQKGLISQYIYNEFDRLEKVKTSVDNSSIQISDAVAKGLKRIDNENPNLFIPSNSFNDKDAFIDANGNQISFTKDVDGLISSIVDSRGRLTKIKRDLNSRPIEVIDVDGSMTQMSYDNTFGDLIQTKNVTLNITTQKAYNIYGQVINEIDPYGKSTTYEYNQKLLPTKTTAPDGKYQIISYSPTLDLPIEKAAYDSSGVLQGKIIYEYDQLGRMIKQTALNGKYSTYVYDDAGNVLTVASNIDSQNQSITSYEYDAMNRLVKVTSPKNEITEYSYSPIGELLEIKDPNGKITTFEYDLKGQLISKTDPTGSVWRMTYDLNGNLLTELDPNLQTKEYTYNSVNKVTSIRTADDLIQYNYNINDEVVEISNQTSSIIYTRDSKQRIVAETVAGVGNTNYPTHTINYSYTANDLRTSAQSVFQTINYYYNPTTYQLSGVQNSSGNNFSFNYDQANRLSSIIRPGSRTDLTYDVASTLTGIYHSSNGQVKNSFEYLYDERNYITQKRSPASTLNYSYDRNGQLTSVNSNNLNENETFQYDALGNRVAYNGITSTFDQSGQKIQDDGQFTYLYDNNGNILAKNSKSNSESFAFEYSALNQVKRIKVFSAPIIGTVKKVIEFKYDPTGRRIIKSVVDNLNTSKSNTKKFYYDGSNIFAELDAENNLTATYTHSPLGADNILSANFTEYAVTQNQNGSALNEGQVMSDRIGTIMYLKDHLGSISDITDTNGNIIQKYNYSAFGKLIGIKSSSVN